MIAFIKTAELSWQWHAQSEVVNGSLYGDSTISILLLDQLCVWYIYLGEQLNKFRIPALLKNNMGPSTMRPRVPGGNIHLEVNSGRCWLPVPWDKNSSVYYRIYHFCCFLLSSIMPPAWPGLEGDSWPSVKMIIWINRKFYYKHYDLSCASQIPTSVICYHVHGMHGLLVLFLSLMYRFGVSKCTISLDAHNDMRSERNEF